ncbi:MAG: winged helix-turn-helix transcriptional regulator, partial [Nitrososphaeraceae archaeon]
VLGQEVPRDIISFLIESPGATQIDIARHKSLTPPKINWHMSRLIEIGLVSRRKKGKFVKYYTRFINDEFFDFLFPLKYLFRFILLFVSNSRLIDT